MSLAIRTNVTAMQTHRALSDTTNRLSSNLDRLSSGFRINHAADDAAGLAIANRFKSDIVSMKVAQRNAGEATSMIQIAEGAVSSIESVLTRMKELSTQAASGNASTQLSVIDEEFKALQSEIDRIVSSTTYQGTALIDGTFNSAFQVGTTANTYDRLTISLDSMDTTALSIASTSVNVLSQASARSAMTAVDAAAGTVRTQLGKIGAYTNRLSYASNSLATAVQNYAASESSIRDADMAAEVVEMTKNQILQQAGVAMLAQANQVPQSVLQLLR